MREGRVTASEAVPADASFGYEDVPAVDSEWVAVEASFEVKGPAEPIVYGRGTEWFIAPYPMTIREISEDYIEGPCGLDSPIWR